MIIGGPGAGKSWLAAALSQRLDLPVIAIDDLVHDQSGRVRPDADIDADARRAALGERWIIEGGNTRTYRERLARADCVIRLRPGRLVRVWRVLRRGRASWSLLRWTWDYDRVFGARDGAVLAAAGDVLDLRSAGAVREFLAGVGRTSGEPQHPHPGPPPRGGGDAG